MKKLTIAIPVYKGRKSLYNLLDDIYAQSIDFVEVIIHENYSEDLIEAELLEKYDGIKYKLHKQNFGFDYNISSLISSSTTEYVWFIGCDDRMLPNSIEQMINFLDGKDLGCVIVNWDGYNEKGVKEYDKAIILEDNFITSDHSLFFQKLGAQFFISSYIINKNKYDSNKQKPIETYKGFIHWAIFLSVAIKSKNAFYANPLIRHYSGGETYLNKWIKIFFIDIQTFLFNHVDADLRKLFLNNDYYNFSLMKNIVHKKALYNNHVDLKTLVKIFKFAYKYPSFYIFNLPVLLTPNFVCKLIFKLKKH
jgi:glycosyltransferase involved in cell wall biosynthesis